jgi:hypothetical protein
MRSTIKFAAMLGAIAFFGGAYATPASAQATRTWVSGVGDDANPCSRTAPCKTFAGAISKTATGGEINCLDPGGFGGVTITKSLSIVCNYTEGGILSAGAGVNGIIVNGTATSHIYLRGLDLHGAGNAQNGLRIIAGASVTVEDTVIRAYNASNGLGISFQPSGATQLNLNNVTISNNGSAGTGGGILIQPTGVGGSARVFMNNVRVFSNANNGLNVNTTGASNANGIQVSIENSEFASNATGVNILQPGGTQNVAMSVNDSSITGNTTIGFNAAGAGTIVRFDHTTITSNQLGISSSSGAQLLSYGGNRLDGNPAIGAPADGSFTGAIILRK